MTLLQGPEVFGRPPTGVYPHDQPGQHSEAPSTLRHQQDPAPAFQRLGRTAASPTGAWPGTGWPPPSASDAGAAATTLAPRRASPPACRCFCRRGLARPRPRSTGGEPGSTSRAGRRRSIGGAACAHPSPPWSSSSEAVGAVSSEQQLHMQTNGQLAGLDPRLKGRGNPPGPRSRSAHSPGEPGMPHDLEQHAAWRRQNPRSDDSWRRYGGPTGSATHS